MKNLLRPFADFSSIVNAAPGIVATVRSYHISAKWSGLDPKCMWKSWVWGFIRAAMGVDSKDTEALIKDVVRRLELHGEMCVGLSFLFVI
jgi:hypothetical protein